MSSKWHMLLILRVIQLRKQERTVKVQCCCEHSLDAHCVSVCVFHLYTLSGYFFQFLSEIVCYQISDTMAVQFRRSGTEPLPVHRLAALSLFRVVTLFGHPPLLHRIYKRPKGLFSVNAFYMNPSLCLCKPSYSSKQSSIEAVLLNLQPDGSSTPRQSGELQFVLKV